MFLRFIILWIIFGNIHNVMNLCTRNRKGFGYGCKKGGCGIAVTFNSIISSKYSNFLFITKINA